MHSTTWPHCLMNAACIPCKGWVTSLTVFPHPPPLPPHPPQLSDDITAKQAASAATSEALEAARTRYRPLAATAACLFFAIAALQALDHMYQYSLAWFIGERRKGESKPSKRKKKALQSPGAATA